MTSPDPGATTAPPDLVEYVLVHDGTEWHATYTGALPPAAILDGCQRVLSNPDLLQLTQAAVRNRVKAWAWQSQARSVSGEEP